MTPTETLLGRLGVGGPALEWGRCEPRSVGVAWATCPRGDWLIDVAARLGHDRRTIVRAASDCVALALPQAAAEPVARRGWETARSWVDGRATAAQCWAEGAAARDAAELYEDAPATQAALRAVAQLCLACDERAEDGYWADQAHAADATRHAADATGSAGARHAADLVRAHVPYERVAKPVALVLRTPHRSGVQVNAVVEADGESVAAVKRRRDL